MIFENDPRTLIEGYIDAGHDLNATLRWSAVYYGQNAETNGRKLKKLYGVYMAAVVALGLATASFALALLIGKG